MDAQDFRAGTAIGDISAFKGHEQFNFTSVPRILFGAGNINRVGKAALEYGTNALVVSGKGLRRPQPLIDSLGKAGLKSTLFPVAGEPSLELVEAGVRIATQAECDLIISIGGGSAIDAGKAISAMMTNEGELRDYLEVVGLGKPLEDRPLPFIAIPTTSGTGAEVTKNAVLSCTEEKVKVSLRNPMMLPRLAVLDPELTLNLPFKITAYTGLDALTQLIEPYVCNRANPLTDALAVEGMTRAARSLRTACFTGSDLDARSDMAIASLFGGLSLANAGLGAVHGFAAPIGGMFPAPHGAVCAVLLPRVMDVNYQTLRERLPQSDFIQRYHRVGQILTGRPEATAEDGIRWVKEICFDLKVPNLNTYGITKDDFPKLIEKAMHASSMKANPIDLGKAELGEILTRAL